ncbi:MAG: CDP-alcohol phosphatidyltransferase family protein [Candidatus Aenigmatarchaeota archaeon]
MLKSKYSWISVKIGIIFSRIPLSPNAWTALSLLVAILGFLSLFQKDFLAAFFLFSASAAMDAIDGAVARVVGRVTALGAYLDGIVDRLVELLLLLGLMFAGIPDFVLPSAVWLALLIFFSVFVSYARAYADHRGAVSKSQIDSMGGLLERAERMILMLAGLLLYQIAPIYLTYAIIAAVFLSAITALQRIWFVVSHSN